MIEFTMYDCTALTTFLKGIRDASDTVTFNISKENITCQTFSRGNTSMFHIIFDRDYFEVYTIDQPDRCVINVDDVFKILKTVKQSDYVLFQFENYTLNITIEGDRRRVFTLSLFDDYDSVRDLPRMSFDVHANLKVQTLLDCIKDLEIMSSPTIELKTEDNNLSAVGEGGYSGNVLSSLTSAEGEGKAHYNISMFKDVLDFKSISENVELAYSSDMPITFKFSEDNVSLTTLLAPYISKEDL